MLGAIVGGLLENLSLIVGLKALLGFAFVLYALAGLGLAIDRKRLAGSEGSILLSSSGSD
jgi:hypothetical protein